jgi:biopolymer transport protein ExbD
VQFYRPAKKAITIPIVPLIDILVTLLFFFILKQSDLTQKVPRPEMKVNLPTANSLKVKTVTAPRTVLSLSATGEAEIDGMKVIDGFLKETLVANREHKPELKLVLRADEGCPWGKILAAHSAAIQAGYGDKDVLYRVMKPKDSSASQDPLKEPNDQ